MSTCATCQRTYSGKVYSEDRCQRCYRRDFRIARGLPVRTDLISRIQSRVEVDDNGCHVYMGSGQRGYQRVSAVGRGQGNVYVHRVMYEFANGPIPTGLHIDHLCRNRSCCNPDHLEAVTQAENNRRAAAVKYPGIRGVRKTNASARNPWQACLAVDGKQIHLGLFPSWKAAATARLTAEMASADPERRTAIEAAVAGLQGGAK